jgi:hypothetical protein
LPSSYTCQIIKHTATKVGENTERASLGYILGWTALLLHFTKNTEWSGMILIEPLIRLEGFLGEMLTRLAETTYA